MSTMLRDMSLTPVWTTRDGSWKGSPRRNKSFIKLKIAVLAPMASARVTTAMMVNPGVLASVRSAYLKSEIIRLQREFDGCESSFGTKSNNRINARRAARGEPTRDHHRDAEHDRRA